MGMPGSCFRRNKRLVHSIAETSLSNAAKKAVGKLAGYATLTMSNAIVSGATSAAYTMIDNGSADDVKNAFICGTLIGGACTVLASALSEVVNVGMNALNKSHQNNWLKKALTETNTFIEQHRIKLKNTNIEEILAPKSVYCAAEAAMDDLNKANCASKVIKFKIDQLPSDDNVNFMKVDSNGNPITKKELMLNNGDCYIVLKDDCDPRIREGFRGVIKLKVTQGNADLSTISYYSIDYNGTGNRSDNYDEFLKIFANEWKNDNTILPENIKTLIEKQYSRKDLTATDVQNIFSTLGLTPHEDIGKVYLVDTYVHSKLSHAGSVATAKAYEAISVGTIYFNELSSSNPTVIFGSLIAEAVS